MALRTRPTEFARGQPRRDRADQQRQPPRVSYLTGFAVQPNKAIVGRNAFAHESGIHQDGVLKNPLTYEIMTPQSVGLSGSRLSVGKLSGRRGLQGKLKELGHDVEGEALDARLPRGDRPRGRQEGGHRRRPRRARRAAGAVRRSPDERPSPRGLERHTRATAAAHRHGLALLVGQAGSDGVDRQRPGRRAVRRGGLGGRAGPRLAPGPDRLRDPRGLGRRGRPGPGAGPRAALDRPRARADTRTGHGLSTNIIEASLEAYLGALEKLLGASGTISAAFVGPPAALREPRADGRAEQPRPRGNRTRETSRDRLSRHPGRRHRRRSRRRGPARPRRRRPALRLPSRLVRGARRRRRHRCLRRAVRDEDLALRARPTPSCSARSAGPKWDDPTATVRPEQALLALRKALGLFANLRPVTVAAVARAARRRFGPTSSRAWTCSSCAS